MIKRHWSELVCWTQRLETGHPVLLVRLGQAIRTCHGEKADEYGRAIISQVDRGARRLLKNDSPVDTLVAVIDCEGASTANLNKIYGLLHGVPIQLNKVRVLGVIRCDVCVALSWSFAEDAHGECSNCDALVNSFRQEVSSSNDTEEDHSPQQKFRVFIK